jgi:hypothetical protein
MCEAGYPIRTGEIDGKAYVRVNDLITFCERRPDVTGVSRYFNPLYADSWFSVAVERAKRS